MSAPIGLLRRPELPEPLPADAAAELAAATRSRPTGAAAAAVLAAGLGVLALGGANLGAAAYGPFEEGLLIAGRLFLPGGVQLATYSGKELVSLIAWLGSWAVLHWRLRERPVSLTATAGIFLCCLLVATLLLWPPIVYALARLVH